MARFDVHKAYYLAHKDEIVLTGKIEAGRVEPGYALYLPPEIKGAGWVPIHDVRPVQFADGSVKLSLVLQYEVFYSAPLLEFSDLEGMELEVRDMSA